MRRAALLFALLWASPARAGADYAPGSAAWNGLGGLLEIAEAAGCRVRATDALDWSALEARDAVWFVYPRVAVEAKHLKRWLMAGGRAVVADDFGAAGAALDALGIHRSLERHDAPASEGYHQNPRLPLARAKLRSALGQSADVIVANHAATFRTHLPPTFAFARGEALVVEANVGAGYLVALADPSVLINNMLELEGNRAFAEALVARTCAPGGRLLLLTQTFTQAGAPPESLQAADPTSPSERFNQMLKDLNQALRDRVGSGVVVRAGAVALALLVVVTLAGAFPSRSPLEDRWTRARRPPDERQPLDALLALQALRDEVLEGLERALGQPVDFERTGPQVIAERVAAIRGAEAGALAAALWRLLHHPRPPLGRAHVLGVALLDILGDKRESG